MPSKAGRITNWECFYNTQQKMLAEKGVVLNGLKRGLVRWSVKQNRYNVLTRRSPCPGILGSLLRTQLADLDYRGRNRAEKKTGSRASYNRVAHLYTQLLHPPLIPWPDRTECVSHVLISKAVIDGDSLPRPPLRISSVPSFCMVARFGRETVLRTNDI